jgi:hypothetical protein
MASAQDCRSEPGEPASVSSSQSVEVKMEALWWYGISGVDGESVESGSHVVDDQAAGTSHVVDDQTAGTSHVVDDQTAGNRFIETSDDENPQTDRFVLFSFQNGVSFSNNCWLFSVPCRIFFLHILQMLH